MVQQKTLRVKFEKTGKLQYISHLDLLRTMQTALRRAKVNMIYTEGFNPHMRIAFALPLSIGIESVCEYMDIRTEESVDPNIEYDRIRAFERKTARGFFRSILRLKQRPQGVDVA